MNIYFVLCLWLATISLNCCQISAKFPKFEHPTKGDETLKFLVVGDWGRKGDFNQSEVAFQVYFISNYFTVFVCVLMGLSFFFSTNVAMFLFKVDQY